MILSNLINNTSTILFIANMALIYLMITFSNRSSRGYYSILAMIFVIFIAPRFFQFWLVPETVSILYATERYYIGDVLVNSDMFPKVLLVSLVGTLGFFFGASVSSRLKIELPNPIVKKGWPNLTFNSILITLVIIFLLRSDDLLNVFHQHTNLKNIIGRDNFVSLIQVLFNLEAFMAIAIPLLLHQTKYLNTQLWKIYLISFIYVAIKIHSGSRAGGLIFIVLVAISLFFIKDDYKVNTKNLLILVVLVLISSFATFDLATLNRSKLDQMSSHSSQVDPAHSSQVDPRLNNKQKSFSSVDRLGSYFDAMLVVTNIEGRKDLKSKYLNFNYYIKSFVNITLPGTYFPCCVTNTSFLPFFIFGSRDETLLDKPNYYESGMYTLFGLEYLSFGLMGVFLVTALVIVVIDYFARVIARIKGGGVFIVAYLYPVLYMLFFMQGVDAYFVDIVKFGISSLVAFSVIYLISRIHRLQKLCRNG